MSEVAVTSQQDLASKYKSYPEYKDSGVEWLGTIPTHWEMWKLAHAYEVIGSGTTPPTNEEGWFGDGIPWVTTGELREIIIEQTSKCITYEALNVFSALRVHPAGSVVIAMYGATIGRLGILGVNATTNQACCVLTRSIHLDNKYVFYWLQAFRDDIVRLSSGGGQPNINQEKVASLKISAPDERHQRTISAFLDYETARIDRLIAKQQRLIELLKEKRQAVISHAVTKGLNPNAPMKDSGVEWLGQVPEHWVVTNLKYVFDSLDYRRIPLSAEQRGERQGDYPYYGASGVIDGVDDYLFDEECVLVGEDGANLIMRSTPLAFVVSGKYWVNNHAHILRMHDGLNRYWAAVINNVDIKPIVSGSAQPKLTAEALGNIKVAFPQDTTEREELLIHINAETPKFDELIGHANQQVILLKERRSALISAAVTGKIDLRGWTPPAEEVAA
ncbi:MAG: restriction endonuclease subunit S [Aeromonas sp.]|uniref:Restriction endonuclease subunit S n=1 Tax=Aeromonas caviae TaxID=648 RepID=A0AAW9F2E5_AERCA|nr:restriction endonuclease subunit S [Aeromonas caviae]MDU7310969.1 restriction endonuclease subunit S [Aeromonas sp.]MDX7720877.1 restriction endonuclease subunit S [Aeromonas caviae]